MSYRCHALVLVALFFGNLLSMTECSDDPYLASLTQPVNPETTVFAFDLHDVVFKRNIVEVVWRCLTVTCRGGLFYAINPFFWYRVMQCGAGKEITENVYKKLSHEFPSLIRFQGDFYAIANAHRPILGMVEVIDQLKQAGYSIYTLSNLGSETFEVFKRKFPEILGKFDGYYMPCSKNNYDHKPKESFYEGFIEFLGCDKQIIFIDDLIHNIEGARKCNIAGIHCTSTHAVKKVLGNLGVLPTICDTKESFALVAQEEKEESF